MIWFTIDFLRGMKCECLRLLTAGLSGAWAPVVAASKRSSFANENGEPQLMFCERAMLGEQVPRNETRRRIKSEQKLQERMLLSHESTQTNGTAKGSGVEDRLGMIG